MMHHDFKIMPNGNILGVSFISITKENAVAAGLDSTLFVGGGFFGAAVSVEVEMIFELKPDTTGGNNHQIVWEWHILDHVVPKDQAAAHPEKFSGEGWDLSSTVSGSILTGSIISKNRT
jgi:hypothetical protein